MKVTPASAHRAAPPRGQVSDLSQYGPAEDVAKLLLPRGSLLLASTQTVEKFPPRETPLGQVEIPPRTYYM
jgi:hypothetical protein